MCGSDEIETTQTQINFLDFLFQKGVLFFFHKYRNVIFISKLYKKDANRFLLYITYIIKMSKYFK